VRLDRCIRDLLLGGDPTAAALFRHFSALLPTR
jgi:hypothetical protein